MTALTFALRGSAARLLALAALIALLAAGTLSLAPAAADQHNELELILSIVEDSDNIVPPGSTFNVRAQIRSEEGLSRWAKVQSGSHLRLSGNLDWDDRSVTGAAYQIPARHINSLPAATTTLTPLDDSGDPYDSMSDTAGSGVWPVAFGSRTVVARAGTTNGSLLIFDLNATPPRQVLKIDGAANERLAATTFSSASPNLARPAAVWDQNATTAWLFAGAPAASSNVGKLYIWKITYNADGTATSTQIGTPLAPPSSEYTNRHTSTDAPQYGIAVSISPDGQTLAVGAEGINSVGAAYVYSMPAGSGEDWNDLTFADGVKVTPVQIPAWGASTTRPFTASATGRTGANTDCDAYCSAVEASRGSRFGSYLELASDGTLVVSAIGKAYASDTAGGSFSGGPASAGALWVFSPPAGGWSAAPDATAGKTAIAAQADASSWDPTTHYSPGPAKRVERAAAELVPAAWGSSGRITSQVFGRPSNISADGGTITASALQGSGPARIFVFEKPAGGWADSSSPTATLGITSIGASREGESGTDVNHDGSRVVVERREANVFDIDSPTRWTNDAGVVYVFDRHADGWAAQDSTPQTDEPDGIYRFGQTKIVLAPIPQENAQFSAPLYNNAGTRLIFADTDYDGDATAAPKLYYHPQPIGPCSERTVDGETTELCDLRLGNTDVTVAPGTPDGPFTISGSVLLYGNDLDQTASSTLEGSVGTVDELAEVEFDFATDTKGTESTEDDTPYPSQVAQGESTTLQLKLLNENGKASARGAAASVLLSTTRGTLSARLGSSSEELCAVGGRLSCRITNVGTTLTADNADQIRVTVTHPGAARSGAARVRALVVSSSGRTFNEAREVIFGGPPTTLAISEPATALLGYDPEGDIDQRNRATLVVSATDRAGNKATVPTTRYSAKLTGPDGQAVALTGAGRRAGVDWPLRKGGDGDDADDPVLRDGNPQARVTVLAGASRPLPVGGYRLELSAGSGASKLTTTQMFTVAGGAAEVSLSVEPMGELEVEDEITATATVTDASGGPVPDGTLVSFTEQSIGASATLVLVSSSAQRTRGGRASVMLRAVGGGAAYVQAAADGLSDLRTIRVALPPPPPEPITSTATDSFTVWTGAEATSASELLARLPGVSRVSIWVKSLWFSYGVANGRRVPGSVDFAIERGDVLWLASE